MKKYKKVFVLLLSVLMVFSVACSPNASDITSENISSVDDPQPVIIETSEKPSVVEPVSEEPVSEPEPQIDPNEELTWKYLEVDEAWLKGFDGTGGMGLKRNGKLYALTWGVPAENWKKTGIGIRDDEGYGSLVAYGDEGDDNIIMDDCFVVPCVGGSDNVAWYGKSVTTIKLVPMTSSYTVPILQDRDICESLTVFGDNIREFDSYDGDLLMIYNYRNKSGMLKDVRLFDEMGNDMFSSFRDLTYGKEYVLKWNDGVEHEEKMTARWRYYKATGDAITLTGTTTDDPGIIQFNFSTVPSGLYFIVESSGIVEVKND